MAVIVVSFVPLKERLSILDAREVPRVPNEEIEVVVEEFSASSRGSAKRDLTDEVVDPENLVQK
jgi:hypothetical protein